MKRSIKYNRYIKIFAGLLFVNSCNFSYRGELNVKEKEGTNIEPSKSENISLDPSKSEISEKLLPRKLELDRVFSLKISPEKRIFEVKEEKIKIESEIMAQKEKEVERYLKFCQNDLFRMYLNCINNNKLENYVQNTLFCYHVFYCQILRAIIYPFLDPYMLEIRAKLVLKEALKSLLDKFSEYFNRPELNKLKEKPNRFGGSISTFEKEYKPSILKLLKCYQTVYRAYVFGKEKTVKADMEDLFYLKGVQNFIQDSIKENPSIDTYLFTIEDDIDFNNFLHLAKILKELNSYIEPKAVELIDHLRRETTSKIEENTNSVKQQWILKKSLELFLIEIDELCVILSTKKMLTEEKKDLLTKTMIYLASSQDFLYSHRNELDEAISYYGEYPEYIYNLKELSKIIMIQKNKKKFSRSLL